ncbi:hypothetical protein RB2150_05343 [Rhodobacterales bacterium HTCC2150]|nr:hypothetical protein RB2150_05343 [Rhodobacterales bacterium HTCC2150] [Rhodobacteraceae bacterium HTCC2150]
MAAPDLFRCVPPNHKTSDLKPHPPTKLALKLQPRQAISTNTR